ncbi:MAG: hypothetical protein ACOYB1_18680 [Limnohabitans sp.]
MATPYSLRLSYVPKTSAADDSQELDDPVAPPGSDDPSDDPRPEELNGDWLRLEQTPFEEPPAGGFAKWMQDNDKDITLANITEYQEKYASICMDDGSLEVGIEVHKSRSALAYKLIASYGTLSQASAGESDKVESHSVEAGDEIDLQANIDGDAAVTWEGPIYDEDGVQLDQPPTVTQASGKLTLAQKVTGTVRTSYTATYDKYTLTITPRDAANSDPKDKGSAYQSTVMAFWGNGHVEKLDVSMPSMTGNCGAGLDSDDDEDPEDEKYDGDCYDLYIKYHKCTGEEISRELKSVKCPEVVQAECEKKCNEGPYAEQEECLKNCKK